MGHPKSRVFASEMLASVASEASDILFPIAIANMSASAGEIATRLRYIGGDLLEQQLYQLPPDIQSLCLQALQDLLKICKWPVLSTAASHFHSSESPQELRDVLIQLCEKEQFNNGVQRSITKFCKERAETIKPYQLRFVQLSDKLLKNAQEIGCSVNDSGPYLHLRPLGHDVYPDDVYKLLLQGTKSLATCAHQYHNAPALSGFTGDDWHLTMLCLNSGIRSENKRAIFNIITATPEMVYWQEMGVTVPIKDIEPNDVQRHQQAKPFDPSKPSLMEYGDICKRLENPSYAKLYLVEHKIKLSYTVARAFWQFYNSELMNARWTSEDIVFIPLNKEFSPTEGIPLRAFVPFPFGPRYKKSPQEFCQEDQFTHRYPRILYLGIILLEIGLGQALRLEHNPKLSLLAHINTAHAKAKMKLKELDDAEWDGFRWKEYFVEAVRNCFDSTNFKESPRLRNPRQRGSSECADNDAKDSAFLERRDALYQKVVAPLLWLATTGFEDSEEVPLVPIRKKIRRQPTLAKNGDEELQTFWNEIHARPSLMSGSSISTEGFLEDLQIIAGHIARCRRLAKATKPIRVAILDTGCHRGLRFFQNPQRFNRLKGWKDFTSAGSESEIDTFGHGTFMARLLMHVAPIIDVYVVRVAENTEDLETQENSIAKAIEFAGLDPDWNVDIISMSFGFPNKPGVKHAVISDAIDKIKKDRNDSVLFLASAGNSWERRVDFPASHQEVIPIYAADATGAFLRSNPARAGKGSEKLGTYGTDIPTSILEEIQEAFPKAALSAGTSLATAIAAGIVAMMLSYIEAVPALLQLRGFQEVCAKLYTKRGMENMLHVMSLTTGYRQQFINPVHFWGEKKTDVDVFISICSAVEKMNNET
ncbi:peptidase [Metarhizium robertsii ARSEF 23]|uniref:Peptidase n=1 Tax=Metarhizium robertsii (strain ARSEF 23 / ATCC MYA-3075) TaxID=655844 RepID=E9EM25_METRA|nr:peptidase [Metarhizium robertsii ARSEF 23]EFZ03996.2 peptidase [Metarhizium robertsii ARSEF 23]